MISILTRLVGALSRAHQQMVEIAKTLLSDPRILILDKPTASHTERESGRLLDHRDAQSAAGRTNHRRSSIAAIRNRSHRRRRELFGWQRRHGPPWFYIHHCSLKRNEKRRWWTVFRLTSCRGI
ncbi:hypothetical protein JJE66_07045 [Bradyrhizobium diazoefficiens]|uniref:ATP-binding cassette domain-containing protein n=1 Tax=Bradyrhizobium diazoefficiens TaxID=1355477 RepID=UPI00190DC626|nr:hypothetical protein [Bradyrhizobium diazoefficiens]